MSDALSFAEIEGQHVELLLARTVMSLFIVGGRKGDNGGASRGDGGGGGANMLAAIEELGKKATSSAPTGV